MLFRMKTWAQRFAGIGISAGGAKEPASVIRDVARACQPVHNQETDYDDLLNEIGDSQIVCIGEASHGTHDFYRERAKITRRLIAEKGFKAVAWEADWPDAWDVNRYVRGQVPEGTDAVDSLAGFARFPQWMWRNTAVLEFIGWLREWNDAQQQPLAGRDPAGGASDNEAGKAGVYGLDLYSMYTSMGEVVKYLDGVDAEAAQRARRLYSCFDDPAYHQDSQEYGRHAGLGLTPGCEREAIRVLTEMQRHRGRMMMMVEGGAQQQQAAAGSSGGGDASGGSGGTKSGGAGTKRMRGAGGDAGAESAIDEQHMTAMGMGGGGAGQPTQPVAASSTSASATSSAAAGSPPLRPAWPALPKASPLQVDQAFYAELNARLVVDAETYYREMFRGRVNSWNLRDRHMYATLQALVGHLSRPQGDGTPRPPAKVVVWAHNSHLGDARATQMGEQGELNVGQLVRQGYGVGNCYLVGFSTYHGSVTAARRWDGDAERRRVRPGMEGSYEHLLHQVAGHGEQGGGVADPHDAAAINPDHVNMPRCILFLRPSGTSRDSRSGSGHDTDGYQQQPADQAPSSSALGSSHRQQPPSQPHTVDPASRDTAIRRLAVPRLQRAIGVIYKPETERWSHYFDACVTQQFDALIHIDHSRALEPLERTPLWHTGEAEETFPSGL